MQSVFLINYIFRFFDDIKILNNNLTYLYPNMKKFFIIIEYENERKL